MTNHFHSTCGTLIYRKSLDFSTMSILRMGVVDDFSLYKTKLKRQVK